MFAQHFLYIDNLSNAPWRSSFQWGLQLNRFRHHLSLYHLCTLLYPSFHYVFLSNSTFSTSTKWRRLWGGLCRLLYHDNHLPSLTSNVTSRFRAYYNELIIRLRSFSSRLCQVLLRPFLSDPRFQSYVPSLFRDANRVILWVTLHP